MWMVKNSIEDNSWDSCLCVLSEDGRVLIRKKDLTGSTEKQIE